MLFYFNFVVTTAGQNQPTDSAMEWLLNNTQIHSTFASLGSVQGDNYVASSDCLGKL